MSSAIFPIHVVLGFLTGKVKGCDPSDTHRLGEHLLGRTLTLEEFTTSRDEMVAALLLLFPSFGRLTDDEIPTTRRRLDAVVSRFGAYIAVPAPSRS